MRRWAVLLLLAGMVVDPVIAAHRSAATAGGPVAGRNVVGIAASPAGQGYWVFDDAGVVVPFRSAPDEGSEVSAVLRAPVVGMAAAPDGGGYWLVGSDGGVFSFGDAAFHGSAALIQLRAPVVGIASTPDGAGYWLVGSDGRVSSFGDAVDHGSVPTEPAAPVVGMAATPGGGGYWLVGSDGGVFSFGDASTLGGPGAVEGSQPSIGLFGDSLSWEAQPYFSYLAAGTGAQVVQWTAGGAAPCDALSSMARAAGTFHLRAAVVQFGGNAATPCMADYPAGTPRFFTKYRSDTVEAIRIFTRAGTHVYLAGAPPASTALGSANLSVLNRMYAGLAADYPGVSYEDAGGAVTLDGRFAWSLPCLTFEPCLGPDGTNTVRAPDGVHFCPDGRDQEGRCDVYSSGAFRYAMAMLGPALSDVGS